MSGAVVAVAMLITGAILGSLVTVAILVWMDWWRDS